jgi:hypothetical protein
LKGWPGLQVGAYVNEMYVAVLVQGKSQTSQFLRTITSEADMFSSHLRSTVAPCHQSSLDPGQKQGKTDAELKCSSASQVCRKRWQ